MTERNEREALIAEASDLIAYHLREQEFDPRYRPRTPAEQAELIGRLVAALRKHPEPEWEYAHSANGYWSEDETEFTAEDYYDVSDEPHGALARRTKAGPWEPVE